MNNMEIVDNLYTSIINGKEKTMVLKNTGPQEFANIETVRENFEAWIEHLTEKEMIKG